MKTVECIIKGVSPLLINRFHETKEVPVTLKKNQKKDYGTPREQAEKTAYFDEDTEKLWVPSSWVKGSLLTVSSDFKLPGSRRSAKSVTGGVVIPVQEKLYFNESYLLKDIEVDSRPCVVQRSRIMRSRARLESWSFNLSLMVDESILPLNDVHEMLAEAGRRAGIGDFRPQKGGPFGRFLISGWQVQ